MKVRTYLKLRQHEGGRLYWKNIEAVIRQLYLWKNAPMELENFYKNISRLCEQVRKASFEEKVI